MIDTHRLAALPAPTGLRLPDSAGHILVEAWRMCRTALRDVLGGRAATALPAVAASVTVTRHGAAIDIYDRELVRMIALNGEFVGTALPPTAGRPKKAGSRNIRARPAATLEPAHLFRYEGELFNCHMAPGG